MNFKQQELVFYDNSNCFNLLNKVAENFLNDKHYFNGCESFLNNPVQALMNYEYKLESTNSFLENRITKFIKCYFFFIDYCSLISSSNYNKFAFNFYYFNMVCNDVFDYSTNLNELELSFNLNLGFQSSVSKSYKIKLFDDIDDIVKPNDFSFYDLFEEKTNSNALPFDDWIRKFRECENLFVENHLKPFLKENNIK